MKRIAIVVCCENSLLELQTACLLTSIRKYAGKFSQVPFHIFAPRPQTRISDPALRYFSTLDAASHPQKLNFELHDYDLANKPYALEAARGLSDSEIIVWMDSDMLLWKEPFEFDLPDDIDLAAAPESCKNDGSCGPDDPHDEYWRRLYAVCRTQEEPFVTTSVDHQRIRAYYNSGLLVIQKNSDFVQHWRNNIITLVQQGIFPASGRRLVEQTALSATAHSNSYRFRLLSVRSNYFVAAWQHIETGGGPRPEDATIWHYQPFFGKAFARLARKVRKGGFDQHLFEDFIEDLRVNYKDRVGLDEPWFQSFRRRLRLGIRLRQFLGIARPTDKDA